MYYIIQGLKNSICSPAFTDVRDGIIAAATATYGGEDVCTIWTAFAEFGLGSDAVSGGSGSTTPTNGFNIPASCSFLGSTRDPDDLRRFAGGLQRDGRRGLQPAGHAGAHRQSGSDDRRLLRQSDSGRPGRLDDHHR